MSRQSLNVLWDRHVLDSAQLVTFLTPKTKSWVDFGSGAGFPGIVIAILARERFPDLLVTLIDSDKRKCVFLNEVLRQLQLNVVIVSDRIENCTNFNADIISARALAPLEKLLFYFDLHSDIKSKGLFLKGKNFKLELNKLNFDKKFNIQIKSSLVDNCGVIVEVEKVRNN